MTVSLCTPGCSGTLSVEQDGLELRKLASASGVHHHHPAFALVFNLKSLGPQQNVHCILSKIWRTVVRLVWTIREYG